MPRQSILGDRERRNRVIRAVMEGATVHEAAAEVGATYHAVRRYCLKDPDFAERLERAKERSSTLSTEVVLTEAAPKGDPPRVVSAEAVATAQMTGVDADLWDDIGEDWLANDLTELDTALGLSAPSPRKFVMVCWVRMCSDRKDAARWAEIIKPVMLMSAVRAQERRDARVARKEALDDQIELARPREGERPSGGLTILEVPHNPARPFLASGTMAVGGVDRE